VRSILADAARVLSLLVDADGEMTLASLAGIARALDLPLEQTERLVGRVAAARFVEEAEGNVQPTVAGIAAGSMLAAARESVREQQVRPRGGPWWTYLPEEVTLAS
jgi:DNA-binding IclR family transcriptional regulator